jgi:hypothetical protein
MTLYIVEKKNKKEWTPLAFFCFSENTSLGVEYKTISCTRQSHEKAKQSFEIAKLKFPEDRFRIKEYKRV